MIRSKNFRLADKRLKAFLDLQNPEINDLIYTLVLTWLGLLDEIVDFVELDGEQVDRTTYTPSNSITKDQAKAFFMTDYKYEYASALQKKYPKLEIDLEQWEDDIGLNVEAYQGFCKELGIKA